MRVIAQQRGVISEIEGKSNVSCAVKITWESQREDLPQISACPGDRRQHLSKEGEVILLSLQKDFLRGDFPWGC